LRLALLAPDIIEAILVGRADGSPMLEQLERPLPASWEEQRNYFGRKLGTQDSKATAGSRGRVVAKSTPSR
jgi:hypothetical protein